MGRKNVSERRRQRRHYLKYMKKQIGKVIDGETFTTQAFEDMKKSFRAEGRRSRIDDLREKLEAEKEVLAVKEKELRDQLKEFGKKPKEIDAAVVLGIIERGETAHGLVMAQSVSNKILDIQLDHMKPVGMGILGPEIFPSQISARVEPYARAAAEAAIRMLGEK